MQPENNDKIWLYQDLGTVQLMKSPDALVFSLQISTYYFVSQRRYEKSCMDITYNDLHT